MQAAQGNHSMHSSAVQNPAEGKYNVHSCTRWRCQNQYSFIRSNHSPPTPIFSATSPSILVMARNIKCISKDIFPLKKNK